MPVSSNSTAGRQTPGQKLRFIYFLITAAVMVGAWGFIRLQLLERVDSEAAHDELWPIALWLLQSPWLVYVAASAIGIVALLNLFRIGPSWVWRAAAFLLLLAGAAVLIVSVVAVFAQAYQAATEF